MDRSLGAVEKGKLTPKNALYTKVINMLLFDRNGAAGTAGGLASLRLEVSAPKTVVERTFAPPCLSGLFPLKFYLLDHAVVESVRFVSLPVTDAASFEGFSVRIKQSYMIMFWRHWTRVCGTVHIESRALDSVQREESQVHGSVVCACLLQKKVRGR